MVKRETKNLPKKEGGASKPVAPVAPVAPVVPVVPEASEAIPAAEEAPAPEKKKRRWFGRK